MSHRRGGPPVGGPHEGGYSLVELTVAMILLLFVFLVATQLFLETQRVFVRVNAEAQNPVTTLVWAQLRSDIHAAHDIASGVVPTGTRLDLIQSSGRVRYLRLGEDFERQVLDADGNLLGTRTMLRDVVDWRWEAISGLILVRLTHRILEVPQGAQLADPLSRRVQTGLRTDTFWFAPRGAVRGSW